MVKRTEQRERERDRQNSIALRKEGYILSASARGRSTHEGDLVE